MPWEPVCLTTETPRDVPYSEHMGYEGLSEVQVRDLHSRSPINRAGNACSG